jgi:hypothetical protein
LNACRTTVPAQIGYAGGITVGFIVFLLLAIYLSRDIPFLDAIVSLLLGIFAAVFGLTDMFSSPLNYVFISESIVFIFSTAILIYNTLWGSNR